MDISKVIGAKTSCYNYREIAQVYTYFIGLKICAEGTFAKLDTEQLGVSWSVAWGHLRLRLGYLVVYGDIDILVR